MIIERANYIEGFRIEDGWRDAMWLCIRKGYDYVIKGGSYKGQIRRQLPFVTIRILNPGKRPLAPYMPPSIPPPTTDENIEKYFNDSLMNPDVTANQQYTYGNFIVPQLMKATAILLTTKGDTNQATISIGDQNSIFLEDPPCLRVISFKVTDGKLNMTLFFRSWDLIAGLPENLGGFQLVKEYVLVHFPPDWNISDGEIIAYSDGLHIYEQYFDIANVLNVDKIQITENIAKDKKDFRKKLNGI